MRTKELYQNNLILTVEQREFINLNSLFAHNITMKKSKINVTLYLFIK